MAKTIEFTSGARADFDESFDWYAERSERAAVGFAEAADDAITKIVENSSRFARTIRGCQDCSLKRYPFRVVFQMTEEPVLIVAIAHAKRRPNYWQHRV
jgi:plasmid stabilization system protein ParE